MEKRGMTRLIPMLAALLAVFTAAFFLGRQTVSEPVSIELERKPKTEAVQQEAVSLRELPQQVETAEPVNLNTASKEELMTLPGVGEVLAERILSYREQYGRFSAEEQIMDVEGIGEATFSGLAGLITIGEENENISGR